MNMSITYWLSFENMERCFTIYRKGTVFEHEPAYITAYEVCKGLNEYYQESDVFKTHIPLRDASTGTRFSECATTGNIDAMVRWLREKHDIFYFPGMNLCIPLEDPLSRSVKKFWDEEDAQQKQIEDYCKNDPACGLSLKKLHNQYVAHHVPPIKYSFPIDKPVGRVTNAHIGQPGEGIRIDIDLFDKELWGLISDEPVPEIKTTTDHLKFYRKVLRTVAKQKNELQTLREDYDSLNKSYDRLWEDKERKKRMLNSYYGATCGATADAYGEIQRLKKERDELKERLEKLEGGGYACSGCKRTTCGYFAEILSTLGVKNAVVYPARGQSKVECFAKLANERAQAVMKENRVMAKTIDTHVERLNNQEEIIKTQNKSLERQARQLKDLGVALGNVKNTVGFEIDTLMSDHGDEIIPEF